MTDKERILNDIEEVIELITITDQQNITILEMSAKIGTLSDMKEKLVRNNAKSYEDQESFNRKYNDLKHQQDESKKKLDNALAEKTHKQGQAIKMKAYLETIRQAQEGLTEWSDDLWMTMVETATVNREKTITFRFTKGNKDINISTELHLRLCFFIVNKILTMQFKINERCVNYETT